MTAIEKILSVASAEVGYLEKSEKAFAADPTVIYDKTEGAGKDNITKYWQETKPSFQGQAWCQDFVYYCFVTAFGIELAQKMLYLTDWSQGDKWTNYYTPDWAQNFKDHEAWVQTSKAQVGDIVYFKNSSRIHHTGIVVEVYPDYIVTIEGNTSSMDNVVIDNGGAVSRKRYTRYSSGIPTVAGYGRPKYSLFTEGKPTIKKGYKDSVIGGNYCYQLQHSLNDLEIYDDDGLELEEDGSCGGRTVQAIRRFQQTYGLEVTGVCDAVVWEAISKAQRNAIISLKDISISAGKEYTYDDMDMEYYHLKEYDIWVARKYFS